MKGFSIIELVTALGIAAILAVVSTSAYVNYTRNADTTDALATISVLREQIEARVMMAGEAKLICDDSLFSQEDLIVGPMILSITTLPADAAGASGGHGAGAAITADVAQHGTHGIAVARILHEELSGQGADIRDAVLTESFVAFSILLSYPHQSVCHASSPSMSVAAAAAPAPTPTDTLATDTNPTPQTAVARTVDSGATRDPSEAQQPFAITGQPDIDTCPHGTVFVTIPGSSNVGVCVNSGGTSTPSIPGMVSSRKDPYAPVACQVCSGPPFLCEVVHETQTCSYPTNYCVNKVTNYQDGTKDVVRRCGNHVDAWKDWFRGSSDNDRCRKFDQDNEQRLDFSCTFTCIEDGCNNDLHPPQDTLWRFGDTVVSDEVYKIFD